MPRATDDSTAEAWRTYQRERSRERRDAGRQRAYRARVRRRSREEWADLLSRRVAELKAANRARRRPSKP